MNECLHPTNKREAQQFSREREDDLRSYLLRLAAQGTVTHFGFREGFEKVSEEAKATVVDVQQAIETRAAETANLNIKYVGDR